MNNGSLLETAQSDSSANPNSQLPADASWRSAAFCRNVKFHMRFIFVFLVSLSCSLASAQNKADLVRVLKSERKLELVANGKIIKEFKIALGSDPKGHKQQEGDGKTPEGKYVLDYKKADSAYYKAIHVSYPNENDVSLAKARSMNPGGQIMIHGQKNGLGWLSFISQRMDWTQGCVALANDDMDTVWNLIEAGTKIEILP